MQNFADQHRRKGQVVGVLASAGGLAGGIDHSDRTADDGEIWHHLGTRRAYLASSYFFQKFLINVEVGMHVLHIIVLLESLD
jgi:hypothetical protein